MNIKGKRATQEGKQNGGFLYDAVVRYRVLKPHLEEGVPLPQLARERGISLRTARRWLSRYREGGMAGLARKSRVTKGARVSVPEPLLAAVEALALRTPRWSVAAIHRQITALAAKEELSAPSYSTVYNVVSRLDPAIVMLAHQGSKAYAQIFELLYRREAQAPNALWQADHSQLPILLLDESGRASKPWLTVILDDYSRAVCGYFLSFHHPSAERTALALHQAIWRKREAAWRVCGIPQVLYTDNGSDFTSRRVEQVCAELKIRTVFSQPGQPRGRGRVERFFATVEQLLLMHLSGYAPTGAKEVQPTLALAQLDQALKEFVIHSYHQRPHGTTGMPPLLRWEEDGFLPQLPSSREQLDLLLLTVAQPRRVRRDGVHFSKLRYIDPLLAAYVGEQVTMRYDPRDLAEVRVYHQGQFLCRAVCQELAGETVSLQDILHARRTRRKQLQTQLKARRSFLDALLPAASSEGEAIAVTTAPEEVQPSGRSLKRYANE